MNHLNKQLEANHSALEHYLAEENRKDRVQKRLDLIGLGLMILCGLIGLFYCFSNANSIFKKNNKTQTGILVKGEYQYAIAGINSIHNSTAPASNTSSTTFVNIEGSYKTGELLHFILDDYNTEATYEFYLGNGDQLKISNPQLAYAYDSPGSYEVILRVTYQGETEVAFAKILTIEG